MLSRPIPTSLSSIVSISSATIENEAYLVLIVSSYFVGVATQETRAFFDLRESLEFSIAWICDSRCRLVKEASLHDTTSFE